MKTVIWKYPFTDPTGHQCFHLPQGAEFIYFAKQQAYFCLWAHVDPDAPLQPRQVSIYGTGHPINDGAKYIGSLLDLDGLLVWHAFEEQP